MILLIVFGIISHIKQRKELSMDVVYMFEINYLVSYISLLITFYQEYWELLKKRSEKVLTWFFIIVRIYIFDNNMDKTVTIAAASQQQHRQQK